MDNTEIAKIIEANGGRLYLVGGFVRDFLMKKKPKDTDFCVVGISPEKFLKLFPESFIIGSSFPVFKLNNSEFAFARKETKTFPGHKGFLTQVKNVSIEEDLYRRDVTINSIAIDVLTNKIVDPYNGQEDIKNKILRATSKHFSEDPLRVYRVAGFAARFNFLPDNDTLDLMHSMKVTLSELSSERVFAELFKGLTAEKPSVFFNTLKEADVLDVHFKEIYDLINVPQPIKYHPEGDAYIHSLIVLDKVSLKTKDEKTRFAALVHDLGKGVTPKEILPHHYNHDKNGIVPLHNLAKRLNLPNAWKKLSSVVVSEHMHAGMFETLNIKSKVTFLEKNRKFLKELETIAVADSGNENLQFFELGKKLIDSINGKTMALPDNKNAKKILHERRVQKLKEII